MGLRTTSCSLHKLIFVIFTKLPLSGICQDAVRRIMALSKRDGVMEEMLPSIFSRKSHIKKISNQKEFSALAFYKDLKNIPFFIIIVFYLLTQSCFVYGEEFVPIPQKKQSCLATFQSLLSSNQDPKYMLRRQVPHVETYNEQNRRYLQRMEEAKKAGLDHHHRPNFYAKTSHYEREYKRTGEFGLSFDPSTNTSTLTTFGSESMVRSIDVSFYKSPDAKTPALFKGSLKNNGDGLWEIEIEGNVEGLWYQFDVTPVSGAKTQYNEVVPNHFKTYDLLSYFTDPHGKFSLAYYPPKVEQRPPRPKSNNARTILEINLADIEPDDLPMSSWAKPTALLESQEIKELIGLENFDAVELMPIRTSSMISQFSSNSKERPFDTDVLYNHYWQYMGRDFGYSHRFGGIEETIDFIDRMHLIGKSVYIDQVFQHTAHHMKEFQYMIKRPYLDFDRTGTGNTLDLNKGSLPYRIMKQAFVREMDSVGADGTRQDLFGAIPVPAVLEMIEETHNRGLRIHGEPYGYPYEVKLEGSGSYWNTDTVWKHDIRGARLWDHKNRDRLKEMVKNGGRAWDLLHILKGGSYFSWKKSSDDAITILETHDGPTLAFSVGNKDSESLQLRKMAHATGIQFAAQGDILIGPGQIIGLSHHELNDTPISYKSLTSLQTKYNLLLKKMVKIRSQFSHYFSFQYFDETKGDQVKLIPTSSEGTLAMHFKNPPDDVEVQYPGELIVMSNVSSQDETVRLPPGDWKVLINTDLLLVQVPQEAQGFARYNFTIKQGSTVWLLQEPGTKFDQ